MKMNVLSAVYYKCVFDETYICFGLIGGGLGLCASPPYQCHIRQPEAEGDS